MNPNTPDSGARAYQITGERDVFAQRDALVQLAEVAAHMPDTVTRIRTDGTGYTITIGYAVTFADIDDIIKTASDTIGHWARTIRREPDGATIITEHDGDYGPNGHSSHIVTVRNIAESIASILDGDTTCDTTITRNLRDYLRHTETIDPETADVIIQHATFGRIAFD